MAHITKYDERQRRGFVYREAIKENTLTRMTNDRYVKVKPCLKPHDQNHTILKGRIHNVECTSNLSIHMTDMIEVREHQAKAILEPAVTFSLILKGYVEGTIGGQNFVLDGSVKPMGYMWAMNEPMLWIRNIHKDMHVRKINISVDREWLLDQVSLEEDDAQMIDYLSQLLQSHISIHDWVPSKRALALAEQLLQPSNESRFIQRLHVESRALEILCEALKALFKDQDMTAETNTNPKAQIIRSYLEDHIEDELNLNGIARSIGMAVNSMQRSFKATYSMTVMDYIRERRLEVAKEAIERDGLSIAQAAHKARYNSPANFATAFKRVYGFSPSDLN